MLKTVIIIEILLTDATLQTFLGNTLEYCSIINE